MHVAKVHLARWRGALKHIRVLPGGVGDIPRGLRARSAADRCRGSCRMIVGPVMDGLHRRRVRRRAHEHGAAADSPEKSERCHQAAPRLLMRTKFALKSEHRTNSVSTSAVDVDYFSNFVVCSRGVTECLDYHQLGVRGRCGTGASRGDALLVFGAPNSVKLPSSVAPLVSRTEPPTPRLPDRDLRRNTCGNTDRRPPRGTSAASANVRGTKVSAYSMQ